MICNKCHNYELGKCKLGKCSPEGYSCFENRILHISNNGEYGDEMSEFQIGFMKQYCQNKKDYIKDNDDYTGFNFNSNFNKDRKLSMIVLGVLRDLMTEEQSDGGIKF